MNKNNNDTELQKDPAAPQESQQDGIVEMGSVTSKSDKGVIHCLTIIGQIEGHQVLPEDTKTTKYEHVMPLLAAIEESDEIDALLILLNTMGGDVEAGLGIAELIAGMKKPVASLVLGGGHSIGVPLAVAAQRSFIVPSAAMTIHPVRMNGLLLGIPQTLSYFERMQERTKDGSILIISHQERILNIADEIVVIRNGQIADHGPKERILPTLLGTSSAVDICNKFSQGGKQA